EQSAAARELTEVAERAGDTEREIWGHFTRYVVLFQAGDAPGTEREVEQFGRLAEELRRPVYYGWTLVYRAARPVGYGRTSLAERCAAVPAWRAPLAHLYCDMAREADARDEFERLAADGFTGVLDSVSGWSVAAVYLAETCARLDDQARAEVLYEAMLPFAGRNPMLGPLANESAVSRQLGLLATV